MRYTSVFVFMTSLVVTLPTTALAQRPVNFSIGGGVTVPNSDVRDRLGDGFNFTIGLQGNLTPAIGIEGLYSFNGLGEKQISVGVAPEPFNGTVPTISSAT